MSTALVERLVGYMMKSSREAQLVTSWIRPNPDYEDALEGFVRRVLTENAAAEFRQSVAAFVRLIEPVSTCHALSQLVLKCVMPGVPDFYQGCEDWCFALTDPDNRRPVDVTNVAKRLARLFETRLIDAGRDLKLQMTRTLLQFRNQHSQLLREAGYRPLRVRGSRAASIVAFERRGPHARVVVVVPRLTALETRTAASLDESFWSDTEVRLPRSDGRWSDLLSAQELVLGCGWCRMSAMTAAGPWVVLHHDGLTPARNRPQ